MSEEKKPWWKTVLVFLGGLVTGLIAFVCGRRVSRRTGKGTEQLGQCVDEIGDSVSRAEERVRESVSTSESVAESVERLRDGTDELENAIGEARGSNGLLIGGIVVTLCLSLFAVIYIAIK